LWYDQLVTYAVLCTLGSLAGIGQSPSLCAHCNVYRHRQLDAGTSYLLMLLLVAYSIALLLDRFLSAQSPERPIPLFW
jgi:hypothetical protein